MYKNTNIYMYVCIQHPQSKTHNLASNKKLPGMQIESFVETWMDLETVIQSEVSQKEKNKYRILMHVCGT